jgi:hypothetical protein
LNDTDVREAQDTRVTADIYFTRGFSSIHLNRKSSAVGPTGVYTCLIPDPGNTLRTLAATIGDHESTLL